jgi:hypothetical protein
LFQRYIGRYSPEHARQHEGKPGITGWVKSTVPMHFYGKKNFKIMYLIVITHGLGYIPKFFNCLLLGTYVYSCIPGFLIIRNA